MNSYIANCNGEKLKIDFTFFEFIGDLTHLHEFSEIFLEDRYSWKTSTSLYNNEQTNNFWGKNINENIEQIDQKQFRCWCIM